VLQLVGQGVGRGATLIGQQPRQRDRAIEHAELNGEPVTGPTRDRLVLFQETALFPWMTTYDNILYGPRARGEVTAETLELAEFLLNKVGLQDFRNKYPTQLSGGMQRRAELARAMINNPEIMILDEPFRGLDAMTKELMWEYYRALRGEQAHEFLCHDRHR
jgi:NitT/TauT family transport system ATP-binding protein